MELENDNIGKDIIVDKSNTSIDMSIINKVNEIRQSSLDLINLIVKSTTYIQDRNYKFIKPFSEFAQSKNKKIKKTLAWRFVLTDEIDTDSIKNYVGYTSQGVQKSRAYNSEDLIVFANKAVKDLFVNKNTHDIGKALLDDILAQEHGITDTEIFSEDGDLFSNLIPPKYLIQDPNNTGYGGLGLFVPDTLSVPVTLHNSGDTTHLNALENIVSGSSDSNTVNADYDLSHADNLSRLEYTRDWIEKQYRGGIEFAQNMRASKELSDSLSDINDINKEPDGV